jgi:nucleotide-binding universal stress UspA family protein
MKTKKVIVGFDYTESGKNALLYAFQYAEKGGYELEVFHLIDFPVIYSNSGLYFIDYNELKQTDKKRLEKEVFRIIPNSSKVKITCLSSFLPMNQFVKELKDNKKKYAAMVMGYNSGKGVFNALKKSTGVKISGEINIPLFIIKDFKYPFKENDKAVALVDNNRLIRKKSIEKISETILPLGLNLMLVHIHTPDEWLDIYEFNYKKDFEKWKVTDIHADTFEAGVKKTVREFNPALIAILSEKHNGIYKLFNQSHTEKVLKSTRVPVLSLHI